MGRLNGVRGHVSPFRSLTVYIFVCHLSDCCNYCTAYFIWWLKSGEAEASPVSPTPTGLHRYDHFTGIISLVRITHDRVTWYGYIIDFQSRKSIAYLSTLVKLLAIFFGLDNFGISYSQTSLIRTPVIRAPPSTGQLICFILC